MKKFLFKWYIVVACCVKICYSLGGLIKVITIYDEGNYIDRYSCPMVMDRSVEKVLPVSSVNLHKQKDSKAKKKERKKTNQFRNIYNEKVEKKI